ncbi:hypothetical protein FOXYSP1_20394 [Fusarium oxysporum f. sp. phaseoli]
MPTCRSLFHLTLSISSLLYLPLMPARYRAAPAVRTASGGL